ncbi:MAG: GEVED domain-containing protein [Candidatus Aminicenantes bacterium]
MLKKGAPDLAKLSTAMIDAFFPGDLADLPRTYIASDFRGLAVLAYPFQYNLVRNLLRVYTEMTVRVYKNGSTVTGSFNVPTSGSSGATRMRVIMKYSGYAAACGTFTYGEVEDYTVNIRQPQI